MNFQKEKLETFIELCQELGNDPLLIQGPGGNFSVKTSPSQMIIKASGIRLKEISPQNGWVEVNLGHFNNHIKQLKNEKEYAELVANSAVPIDKTKRPSMELGFHASIPHPWVAHYHSIAGQLLTIDPQGKEYLSSNFPDIQILTIPFILPGLELSLNIMQSLKDIAVEKPLLILLQYHGLVIGAPSHLETLTLAKKIEGLIREKYEVQINHWDTRFQKAWAQLESNHLNEPIVIENTENCADWFLEHSPFPDFTMMISKDCLGISKNNNLVFRPTGNSITAKRDQLENLIAGIVLVERGLKFGFPLGIPNQKAEEIRELPTEKARMKVLAGKPQ